MAATLNIRGKGLLGELPSSLSVASMVMFVTVTSAFGLKNRPEICPFFSVALSTNFLVRAGESALICVEAAFREGEPGRKTAAAITMNTPIIRAEIANFLYMIERGSGVEKKVYPKNRS